MKVSTGYSYCRELSFSRYISNNRGINIKIAYKLTDSGMRTYYEFQWELGKWYETTGEGELCSPGWLHFYSDPLVGMFMNPAHANIKNPRLFRAEVEGKGLNDHGTNCGYSRAKLVEELPLPQISSVQWIRFAILCAKEVYKGKKWNKWADNWLSGKDRTINTVWSIKYNFCITHTLSPAEIAFYAAESAESAASAESTFSAAENAASAAESAVRIATESKEIDLIGIAQKAMEE